MKTYGWSKDYCLDEIDGAESWAWYNFAVENEAQIWGTGVKIKGDGYIARERKRLMKQTPK